MKPELTESQIKLLLSHKEDLKAIAEMYCMEQDIKGELSFDSFASQFQEKAEQYITLNAPKLSVNEVIEKSFDEEMYLSDRQKNLLEKRLISLVKQKP